VLVDPREQRRPRGSAKGRREAEKNDTPKPRSTKRSASTAPRSVTPRSVTPQAPAPRPQRAGAKRGKPALAQEQAAHAELSPLARSLASMEHAAPTDHDPHAAARVMELHWGDEPARALAEDMETRWQKRGDTLLRHLAEHGAARHEVRADLKGGRFLWIDPEGRASVEAEARVICRFTPATSAVVMGWADPLFRGTSVPRVEGLPAELDGVDEHGAWTVAMETAEAVRAEYLYRVTTPDAWTFLALSHLCFTPEPTSYRPATPVGLVLRGLGEVRRAVESRAEPADVLRERLAGLGRSLVHEAEYAYRDTDWVARLARTGRRLTSLADRLPRASYKSIAAGRPADEWLGRDVILDLCESLSLLEDEWSLFA
jgi:hypothetical protein